MIGDQWIDRRVDNLVPGDEVRDFGTVKLLAPVGEDQAGLRLIGNGVWQHYWPAHARVAVRRVGVAVRPDDVGFRVAVGNLSLAWMRSKRHAECYAEKLRNDPTLRAEALGQ